MPYRCCGYSESDAVTIGSTHAVDLVALGAVGAELDLAQCPVGSGGPLSLR